MFVYCGGWNVGAELVTFSHQRDSLSSVRLVALAVSIFISACFALPSRVFVGLVEQSPPLYADEFLRWSAILASMSREEILLAGTAYKYQVLTTYENLAGPGLVPQMAYTKALEDLVGAGKTFPSKEEFDAACTAIFRTGLLVPAGNTLPFVSRATSHLKRLVQLAKIEGLDGSED